MSSDERDKTRRTQKDDTSSTKGNGGIGGGNGDGGDKGDKRKSERPEQSAIPRETGLGGDKKSPSDKVADMSESDIKKLTEKQVKALDINDVAKACGKDETTREKFNTFIEQHGDKLSNKQIYELDKETLAKVIEHHPLSAWSDSQVTSLSTERIKDLAEAGKLSEMNPDQLKDALTSTRKDFKKGSDEGKLRKRTPDEKSDIIKNMGDDVHNLSTGHLEKLAGNVKYFDQEQVEILAKSDKFATMTPTQIDLALHNTDNGRTIDQAKVIEQLGSGVESLSSDRLQALGESVQYVERDHLQKLKMDDLSATQIETLANEGRFKDLTESQVREALARTDISARDVITAMGDNISDLPAENLKVLGDNIQYVEKDHLQKLGMNDLSADQIKTLAREGRFQDLTEGQVRDSLARTDIPASNVIKEMGKTVSDLSEKQLQALGDNIQYVEKDHLQKLGMNDLSADQIKTLAREGRFQDLTEGQVRESLVRTDIPASDVIKALDKEVLSLSPEQLKALEGNVQYVDATHLQKLKIDDLSARQIETLASEGRFSDLTEGQIKDSLARTDITPDQIIQSLDDKVLSLSPEQLKALESNVQYVDATHLQLLKMDDLSATQIETLASQGRFSDLTESQVRDSLARTDIPASDVIKAMGNNVADLPKENFQALEGNVQFLGQKQVETLAQKGRFADMTDGQIDQALHHSGIVQKEVIGALGDKVGTLSPDQLKALKTSVEHLSETQLDRLTQSGKLEGLGASAQYLSVPQLEGLAKNGNLDKLGNEAAGYLKQGQLDYLASQGHFAQLTSAQIHKALNDRGPGADRINQKQVIDALGDKVVDLPDANLRALGNSAQFLEQPQVDALIQRGKFGTMTADQIDRALHSGSIDQKKVIENLSDNVVALSLEQLRALRTSVEHLSPTQLDKLAQSGKLEGLGSSAQYLSVPQLEGLGQRHQLQYLGTEAAGYLKQDQLNYLASRGDFEQLTPTQINKALNDREPGADRINQKQVIDALGDNVFYLDRNRLPMLGESVQFLNKDRVEALAERGRFADMTGDQIDKALHYAGSDRPAINQKAVIEKLDEQALLALGPQQLAVLKESAQHLNVEQLGWLAGDGRPGTNRLPDLGTEAAGYLNQNQLDYLVTSGNFEKLTGDQINKALNDRAPGIEQINQKYIIDVLGDKVKNFDTERLQGLGKSVEHLSRGQVRDLGTRVNELTREQVQALDKKIRYLDKAQLQALGNNINYLSAGQLRELGGRIKEITPNQVGFLAANDRFPDMTERQIKQTLSRKDLNQSAVIKSMDAQKLNQKQLQALDTNVEYLSAMQVQGLGSRITELKDTQLRAFKDNIQYLTPGQVNDLATNGRFSALDVKQITDTLGRLNIRKDQVIANMGDNVQRLSKDRLQALGTSVEHLSEKQIKGLDNRITYLTEAQIKALDDKVKYLTPSQLQALDNRINELDSFQLRDLGNKVKDLKSSQIETLAEKGRFSTLNEGQIGDISARGDIDQRRVIEKIGNDIDNFDRNQLKALDTNVKYLSEKQIGQVGSSIDGLTNSQLKALGDKVKYLDASQLQLLGNRISELENPQLKALGDKVQYLKTEQVKTLAEKGKLSALDAGQIDKAVRGEEVPVFPGSPRAWSRSESDKREIIQAIDKDNINTWRGDQLKALGDDNAQYLKTDQLTALGQAEKFADLSAEQIKNVLKGDPITYSDPILYPDSKRPDSERRDIVQAIKADSLKNMSGDQLKAFGTDNVQYFDKDQLVALAQAGKFADLDAGQVKQALAGKPWDERREIIRAMDKTQFHRLGRDNLRALDTDVAYFRTDQLVALGQAGKFADLGADQIKEALKGAPPFRRDVSDRKAIVESIKGAENLKVDRLNKMGANLEYLTSGQADAIFVSGKSPKEKIDLVQGLDANIQYVNADYLKKMVEKTTDNPKPGDLGRADLIKALKVEHLTDNQLRDLGNNVRHLNEAQLKTLASSGKFTKLDATQISAALDGNTNALTDAQKDAIVQAIRNPENLNVSQLKAMGENLKRLDDGQADKIFKDTHIVAERVKLIQDLGASIQHLKPEHIEKMLTRLSTTTTDAQKAQLVHAMGNHLGKLDGNQLRGMGQHLQYMTDKQATAVFSNAKDITTKESLIRSLGPNIQYLQTAHIKKMFANTPEANRETLVRAMDTNVAYLNSTQFKAMGDNLQYLTSPQADAAFGAGKTMAEKTLFVEVMGEDIKHLNVDSIGKLLNDLPGSPTNAEKTALVRKMDIHVAKLDDKQLKAFGDNVQFLEQKQLVALAQAGKFHELTSAQIEKAVDKNIDTAKLDKQKIMEAMTVKDIGALNGEQLQKLGENIKYFNKEQLQAISIVEDKSVTPPIRHIRMITAKSLQSLGRKIEYLRPEQIEALDTRIAALTDQQLKVLTPEQVAKLTNNQLDRLTRTTPAKIEQFGKKQMAGLTSEHIKHLRKTSEGENALKVFRGDQISGLQENAFKEYAKYREVGDWRKEQRAGLTREQMGWLDQKQLTSLTSDQMGEFTRQQLRGIRPEQMQLLGEDQLRGLTGAQIKEMTPQQIAGLTPDQLGKLNITDQIPSLRAAHLSVLSKEQIQGLSADQVGALTSVQWKGISARQIKWLRPDQVTEITSERLTRLTEPQIKAFTSKQMKAMDSEQVQAIEETRAKFKGAHKGGFSGSPIDWGGDFDMPDLPPPPMLDPRYADLFKPREMTAEDRQALDNINKDTSLTPDDKKIAKAAIMREWEQRGRDARSGAMKEYEKRLDLYKTMKIEHIKMQQKFAEMKEDQRFKQGVARQQIRMMLFNAVFAGVKSPSQGMMRDLTR